MPASLGGTTRSLSFLPDLPATSAIGKVLGLVALAVMVGFLASAWGIWQGAAWWLSYRVARSQRGTVRQ